MASISIFQEPTALSKTKHKNLRFTPQNNFEFARKTSSAPIFGNEFSQASCDLPIVFAKNNDGEFSPIVLLSFTEKHNSFINDKGQWLDAYKPAFIRQYPFALADKGIICIDEKAPHFSSNDGTLVFDEDGEDSSILKRAKEFLTGYDSLRHQTREFCTACKDANLFKDFSFNIKQGENDPKSIGGLFILDESKLAALPDNTILEWFKKGWLAWSYAHLNSIGTIKRIASKEFQ